MRPGQPEVHHNLPSLGGVEVWLQVVKQHLDFIMCDVRAISLKSFSSPGHGFFEIVIMQVVLHSQGTIPCSKLRLKMYYKGFPSYNMQAFSSHEASPSGPTALLGWSFYTILI